MRRFLRVRSRLSRPDASRVFTCASGRVKPSVEGFCGESALRAGASRCPYARPERGKVARRRGRTVPSYLKDHANPTGRRRRAAPASGASRRARRARPARCAASPPSRPGGRPGRRPGAGRPGATAAGGDRLAGRPRPRDRPRGDRTRARRTRRNRLPSCCRALDELAGSALSGRCLGRRRAVPASTRRASRAPHRGLCADPRAVDGSTAPRARGHTNSGSLDPGGTGPLDGLRERSDERALRSARDPARR